MKKHNLDRFLSEKNLSRAAYMLLAAAFLFLCSYIAGHVWLTLDSDAASELVMGKLLADEGKIVSENFFYSTEIRVFASNLMWMPLFTFLDDWYVIRLVGTIMFLLILLASLFLCCKALEMQKSFPLVALIWLLPFSSLWFNNVLLFVYYIPILAPACLSTYLTIYAAKNSKGKMLLATALNCLMALALGMTSIRMAIVQYMPMMCAVAMLLWLNSDGDCRSRIRFFILTLLPFFATMLGYIINLAVLADRFKVGSYDYLWFVGADLIRFESFLTAWLTGFGYQEGPIFSTSLIFCAQSGMLAVLSIYSVIHIINHREKYSPYAQLSAYFYLCSFVLIGLIFTLSNMQFSNRYLINVCAFSFLPIFACFNNKESFPRSGKYVLCFFMAVILVSSAFKYREISRRDTNATKQEAIAFLCEEGYTEGYATFWNANVLTELSNNQIEVWSWSDGTVRDLYNVYEWLQSVSHVEEQPDGRVFIMLSDSEINSSVNAERVACLDDENIVFRSSAELLPEEGPSYYDYTIWGYDSFAELEEDFYS